MRPTRARWLLLAGSLLGCTPTSVDLSPDLMDLPVDPISAACGSAPGVLARIPGIVPSLMASDNADVYVVAAARSGDPTRQDLWRVPKNGDPPGVLAADQLRIGGLIVGVASDGYVNRVYWTASADPDDGGTASATGAVWRYDPFGADAAAVFAGDRVAPGALIVDDTYLDWAERGVDDAGRSTGVIAQMAGADSAVTTLAQTGLLQSPRAFALGHAADEIVLLWTTTDGASGDQRSAEIDECLDDGDAGLVTHVTGPGAAGVGAIAVLGLYGDYLLYSTPGGIALARLLAAGHGIGPQEGFLSVDGFVTTIAASGDQFFFVDPSTRALMAASVQPDHVAAPVSVAIAPSVDPGTALQADIGCVYFVDAPSGALMAVAR